MSNSSFKVHTVRHKIELEKQNPPTKIIHTKSLDLNEQFVVFNFIFTSGQSQASCFPCF